MRSGSIPRPNPPQTRRRYRASQNKGPRYARDLNAPRDPYLAEGEASPIPAAHPSAAHPFFPAGRTASIAVNARKTGVHSHCVLWVASVTPRRPAPLSTLRYLPAACPFVRTDCAIPATPWKAIRRANLPYRPTCFALTALMPHAWGVRRRIDRGRGLNPRPARYGAADTADPFAAPTPTANNAILFRATVLLTNTKYDAVKSGGISEASASGSDRAMATPTGIGVPPASSFGPPNSIRISPFSLYM